MSLNLTYLIYKTALQTEITTAVEYKKRERTQTPKSQPIPPNSRSKRNFPKLYKYSSL